LKSEQALEVKIGPKKRKSDSKLSNAPREREVMALVVSGLLSKQVGGELGISVITVKAHRGHVMRKMKATSLPDLVTKAARLGSSSGSTDAFTF
jgi:FixJ family two-component response regulator